MGYGEIGAEGLDTGMDLSPSLRAKTRCEIQDGRARKGGVTVLVWDCIDSSLRSPRRAAFRMTRERGLPFTCSGCAGRDCLSQLVNSALISPLKPTEGLNGAPSWEILGNHNPRTSWVVIMAEYSVYLDDGGHPDDQPYLVIAGFSATVEQWLALEPEWLDALHKLGLGAEFHMTDFMAKKYPEFKREQILSTLRGVIQKYTLRPFISAVDMAAYKRVQEELALEECHGAPFALIGRALV